MQITTDILMKGTGCSATTAATWLNPVQAAMDKRTINTAQRVAAFLANVGVESAGLTVFTENCNYSAAGLARTWPNRYAGDPSAPVKAPNVLALRLANNPEAIANNCYANRMGNGDEASGDGWNYRGQGPIQVTGKAAIAKCGAALGIDLLSDPSQLQQPQAGAQSAAWFFESSGCNALADAGNIAGVIQRINGQLPCAANNGPLRISRYHAALDAMSA